MQVGSALHQTQQRLAARARQTRRKLRILPLLLQPCAAQVMHLSGLALRQTLTKQAPANIPPWRIHAHRRPTCWLCALWMPYACLQNHLSAIRCAMHCKLRSRSK